MIIASTNEELSRHISPFSTTFEAFQKMKELYDSHSALKVVQLMIKLFTLELQNNDPLAIASELKSIMHSLRTQLQGSTHIVVDSTRPLCTPLQSLYLSTNTLDSDLQTQRILTSQNHNHQDPK